MLRGSGAPVTSTSAPEGLLFMCEDVIIGAGSPPPQHNTPSRRHLLLPPTLPSVSFPPGITRLRRVWQRIAPTKVCLSFNARPQMELERPAHTGQ